MMNKKFNIKKNIGNIIFIVFLFPVYFFSTLISNYVQHYEYIFSDKNHIKKYKVFSDRITLYAYIDLEPDMYTEGEFSDFKIKKVYENSDYFIGYNFDVNRDSEEIENKYYVVVNKNKATMEFFSEKEFKRKLGNIDDEKFMYVYPFLKKRGTKIGWYR
ncbi:hypothetical protein [Fusobacterium polymorphum]|uniref:hypothetical protein n=1 Tax=Fusobacterium nucleatum subsp. polymorphum TaxID=76857 RepID=UPI003009DC92